jgi:hypothetical protein
MTPDPVILPSPCSPTAPLPLNQRSMHLTVFVLILFVATKLREMENNFKTNHTLHLSCMHHGKIKFELNVYVYYSKRPFIIKHWIPSSFPKSLKLQLK